MTAKPDNRPHEPQFSAGGLRAAREGDEQLASGRSLTLATVARDSRLDRKFLLLITLSSMIATLGLLQGSAAVVIGAMLISPLLGPIMGIGFGLATLDSGLIKRALITLAAGMAVAILVAMVLVWISPIRDVSEEIRARTQPNLLDLGVAVVGGVAGVFAILRKLSGVMVGVAIATALVPPLSTIGFGLATSRPDFALGAALLFLTNTLAIAFAATVIARANRFGPSLTPQHTAMQVIGILVALGLLSIPLGLSLSSLVREARARTAVQSALDDLIGKSDRIDTLSVHIETKKVAIEGVLLVGVFDPLLSDKLEKTVSRALDRPVSASLVQLRQERAATVVAQRSLVERLNALESRDTETTAVIAALRVGGLIPRDRITLDPQLRRAQISRDAEAEGEELAAAIDRVIATARQSHPQWLIETVPVPRNRP